jgi:hypothetical protein
MLFLGRWPGAAGRGPAWETGEAIPWPSAAERRAEAAGVAQAEALTPPEEDTRPAARRRKKKRKR